MRKYVVLFVVMALLGPTMVYAKDFTARHVTAPAVVAKPTLTGKAVATFTLPPLPAGAADACSAQQKKLGEEYTSCMNSCVNLDNPPAGSPADKFNQYTNIQLGQYCGNLSMNDCVKKVKNDQSTYCFHSNGLLKCDTGICCPKFQALMTKHAECSIKKGDAKKVCQDIDTKINQFVKAISTISGLYGKKTTFTQENIDHIDKFLQLEAAQMKKNRDEFNANQCGKY